MQKSKINKLAFTNVFECTKEKLQKMNMSVTRHQRLVCEQKDQKRRKLVLDKRRVLASTGYGTTPLIADTIARLEKLQKPLAD